MVTQHDSSARSFVDVPPDSHFPIQNLPFGVFRPRVASIPRVGVAIGDCVLDLAVLAESRLFDGPSLAGSRVFHEDSLNAFMELGRPAWREARATLTRLLRADEPRLRDDEGLRDAALWRTASVELLPPASIGDYTDFYSLPRARHQRGYHVPGAGQRAPAQLAAISPWATTAGPAPSWSQRHAASAGPWGQTRPDEAEAPVLRAEPPPGLRARDGLLRRSRQPRSETPCPSPHAEEHIFGMVLVNDWSRGTSRSGSTSPLGPFLAKSFATSISPWVVTMDALEPFRTAGPAQDPEPLPYLRPAGATAPTTSTSRCGSRAERMDEARRRIATSNFRHMYWSVFQQLAHHDRQRLQPAPRRPPSLGHDLRPDRRLPRNLLELTWRGHQAHPLPGGGTRKFLQDGDTVVMTGWRRRRTACGSASARSGARSWRHRRVPPPDQRAASATTAVAAVGEWPREPTWACGETRESGPGVVQLRESGPRCPRGTSMATDTNIDLHPTRYWHRLEDGRVQCDVCPRLCQLQRRPARPVLRARARGRRRSC